MSKNSNQPDPESGDTYIYRASYKTRSGKVIYAHTYGLKAFKIKVNPNKKPKK